VEEIGFRRWRTEQRANLLTHSGRTATGCDQNLVEGGVDVRDRERRNRRRNDVEANAVAQPTPAALPGFAGEESDGRLDLFRRSRRPATASAAVLPLHERAARSRGTLDSAAVRATHAGQPTLIGTFA
jgi:hypothetical protein